MLVHDPCHRPRQEASLILCISCSCVLQFSGTRCPCSPYFQLCAVAICPSLHCILMFAPDRISFRTSKCIM